VYWSPSPGSGYVVDGAGTVLVADYSADIAAFTFVGEVLLMLWLLVKARNTAVMAKPIRRSRRRVP
jgi:hypothetical protein